MPTQMDTNEILLEDDFSKLEVGMFSAPVGAHTEYHYLPEAARRGIGRLLALRQIPVHNRPGIFKRKVARVS